jgi:photosystem II stability/assembly factor-like uncharacterized protein
VGKQGAALAELHDPDGQRDWRIVNAWQGGPHCTSVAVQANRIVVGTTSGIFVSDDRGATWVASSQGLEVAHVRWIEADPARHRLFVGTEPAAIFVSDDGASTWRRGREVEALRDKFGWFLPYSPEAGCVRGFAFHGDRAYAAVEVGGVLASDDSGESWRLAAGSDGVPSFGEPRAGFVRPDVHMLRAHRDSPGSVWAATDGGVFASTDAGATWRRIGAPQYTRAVWVDPESPRHLVAGPARSVGRGGTIMETTDGGLSWVQAKAGLDVPWPGAMVERFATVERHLIAVLSDGRLFETEIAEVTGGEVREGGDSSGDSRGDSAVGGGMLRWRAILTDVQGAEAVAAV